MSHSLDVVVPHALGKRVATRRLQKALENSKSRYGDVVAITETEWVEGRLVFSASAFAQTLNGVVEVEEAHASLRVELPLLLRPFETRVKAFLIRKGAAVLSNQG